MILFYCVFLGNEALTSRCGYYPGSFLLLNSGLATHGGSDNRGLSKALSMVFALMVCPEEYTINVTFNEAWTAMDVLKIDQLTLPILNSLALGTDVFFWVNN